MKRGRPKGYKPYIEISYAELGDWVGQKGKVQVSKKWLEFLMGEDSDLSNDDEGIEHTEPTEEVASESLNKIEYQLTEF
jgi:hypothetical protein